MSQFSTLDHHLMSRALVLGERGLYGTDPNPRVGCVLAHGEEIVGEGWHEYAGGPHAEINALARAGDRARGSTAYVTLEPCCHHGRTPPCSDALLRAGVRRVVAAMEDPNPRVAGQGLGQLRDAGVEVASGLLEKQAEALNPGFIRRMREGRPFVRCKLAMSLDGRTAMASGESKWITGEAARLDVQRLRGRSSAIVTGIGTILADDPSLNVRLEIPGVTVRQPLRVILDPHLSTPQSARVLGLPGAPLIISATGDAVAREPLERAGADVVCLPKGPDAVDLDGVMALLAEREVNEVLVESGATLSGAFLRAGLIDELVVYMAPKLMGDGGRGLFHLPGIENMVQAVQVTIVDIRAVGDDWRITAAVAR